MALHGDYPFTPDAHYGMWLQYYGKGAGNYSNYDNPAFDRALEAGSGVLDVAERTAYHLKVQQMLLDEPPVAWVVQEGVRFAMRDNIKGMNLMISDSFRAELLELVEK